MRTTTGATPQARTQPAAAASAAAPAHLSDPDLGAALFAAWSGDPATLISSPPGAGKTRLVTHLAHQLASRARLRVTIAAQTRVQAIDVANRAAALGQATYLLDGASDADRPAALSANVTHLRGPRSLRTSDGVIVATTARWLWTDTTIHCSDVLLVDEAYQLTYADLGALGGLAPQIVLVGDPGQIAPVVTGNTDRWTGMSSGPHLPAPQALLATYGDAVTQLRLSHTWRCGPQTTSLIQPAFYPDLPFTSARPPEHLISGNTILPEITGQAISPTSETDPLICEAVAQRVRDLLGAHLVNTATPLGRPMLDSDIAVVTPHVHQAGLIAAMLADLPNLLIGTANAVQGAERAATVVVHPLCGQAEITDFNTDPGRTCVALTRHRAHATVITDTTSTKLLDRALRGSKAPNQLATHTYLLERIHGN